MKFFTKKSKPFKAWAIKNPKAEIVRLDASRKFLWRYYLSEYTDVRRCLYLKGWRVVRVTITED